MASANLKKLLVLASATGLVDVATAARPLHVDVATIKGIADIEASLRSLTPEQFAEIWGRLPSKLQAVASFQQHAEPAASSFAALEGQQKAFPGNEASSSRTVGLAPHGREFAGERHSVPEPHHTVVHPEEETQYPVKDTASTTNLKESEGLLEKALTDVSKPMEEAEHISDKTMDSAKLWQTNPTAMKQRFQAMEHATEEAKNELMKGHEKTYKAVSDAPAKALARFKDTTATTDGKAPAASSFAEIRGQQKAFPGEEGASTSPRVALARHGRDTEKRETLPEALPETPSEEAEDSWKSLSAQEDLKKSEALLESALADVSKHLKEADNGAAKTMDAVKTWQTNPAAMKKHFEAMEHATAAASKELMQGHEKTYKAVSHAPAKALARFKAHAPAASSFAEIEGPQTASADEEAADSQSADGAAPMSSVQESAALLEKALKDVSGSMEDAEDNARKTIESAELWQTNPTAMTDKFQAMEAATEAATEQLMEGHAKTYKAVSDAPAKAVEQFKELTRSADANVKAEAESMLQRKGHNTAKVKSVVGSCVCAGGQPGTKVDGSCYHAGEECS